MRKKVITAVFLIVCISSSAVFAEDKKKEGITDLTPWKGDNVSIVALYENEAGERFYEEIFGTFTQGAIQKKW